VKASQALGNADVAQCLNYMRGTRLATCLLVNFGGDRGCGTGREGRPAACFRV
jgi:hypothetical protein